MTIKIEFPADNLEAAKHLGAALTAFGNAAQVGVEAIKEFGAVAEKAVAPAAEEIDETAIEDKAGSTDNTATQTAATDARLDDHGVPFNPDMCSNATIPFYASGPNAGQWKRKKGVDQATYDTWYDGAKPPAADTGADAGGPVNTANAFQPDGGNANTDPAAPHDAGTLMAWVSGMQTAGRLTQDQVNSAYTQAELVMPDIFPSEHNTPELIAERVGRLYAILSAWA